MFVKRLVTITQSLSKESGNRVKKTNTLISLLAIEEFNNEQFFGLGGLPLPLDPEVRVKQLCAEKAYLFNSALMPAKLTFVTVADREYVTIFKHGDDLRCPPPPP